MNSVENILIQQVEKNKTPSVNYFIFDKNEIIYSFYTGYADIKNQLEITPKTTYNAYSVTKTFTALAVLQLAEKKEVQIDHPVKKYIPDFPYSEEVTIKHLLTHSAGIPNPIPLKWIHLAKEHPTFERDKFFTPVFEKNNQLRSKPGQKFAYSNLGYILLGQLIENVSGLSYEEYIDQKILNPLNLSAREIGFAIADLNSHAKGYHKKFSFTNLILGFLIDKKKFVEQTEGKWNAFKYSYVNGAPYGGLIGTPGAFVKYIRELLKEENTLISANFKKLLFTENYIDKKPTGMCLSWFSGKLKNTKYFAHAGGGGGYYCEIRIYPERETGSVIMFNRTGMTDERFLDHLDAHFIK